MERCCGRNPSRMCFTLAVIFTITIRGVRAAGDPCGALQIRSAHPLSGQLASPNFPSPYPGGLRCTYNLSTSPSQVIHLRFTAFDLQGLHPASRQCLDAYVLVIVIDRQGRQHVGQRLCGQNLPDQLRTMQANILVEFFTTRNDGHAGFKLQYDFLSEALVREPPSLYFDPDRTMEAACGGRNEPGALSGIIVSPGWPNLYPRNVTCNWLIRVDPHKKIYVRLAHLYLASTLAECERASLFIIDGYKHESTREVRKELDDGSEIKFCGGQLYYAEEGMKSYMSTANRLLVRFRTNNRGHTTDSGEPIGERIGFKLIWTAVESLVEEDQPTDCQQFLCSGGQFCVDNGHNICAARTQLCIHRSLVCDGVANCAENDFSDEQNLCLIKTESDYGFANCGHSLHIIIGSCIAVGVLVFIIIIVVCCELRRKRRRLAQMVRERRGEQTNGKAVWEAKAQYRTNNDVRNR